MYFSTRHLTPSLYAGRLFGRAILEVCLLAALVEGIYLSERSISILRLILDEPIGLFNFIPLLAWTAPEVYLALPIVVLIAVYRVILRSRERLEFIALASGGQSTIPLIRSTTVVAVVALAFSLLISGFVYPYAQFAFRHDVDNIHYQSLRAGSTPGQFLFFPNYVVYVFPARVVEAGRPVFIKQIVDNETYRIVNADRTQLIDGPQKGSLTIRMIGVTVNSLPNVDEPWVASDQEREANARNVFCNTCGDRIKSLRTVSVMKNLDLTNLVHFAPRGVTLDEWTTPELLGMTAPPSGGAAKTEAAVEAVHRLSRSLLCFLAPFLAWLTLTFTTRASQAFVLPASCVALMCGDIAFAQFATRFAPGRAVLMAFALVALTVAVGAILVRQIVARQHLAVFPALARS
jgi:lipopolysaccharide export system permease protein